MECLERHILSMFIINSIFLLYYNISKIAILLTGNEGIDERIIRQNFYNSMSQIRSDDYLLENVVVLTILSFDSRAKARVAITRVKTTHFQAKK